MFDEMNYHYFESITGEDQWHNRLHLEALGNGTIGLLFSIMWKSLSSTPHISNSMQLLTVLLVGIQKRII